MKRLKSRFNFFALATLLSLLLCAPGTYAQHQITTSILEPIWVPPDTIIPIDVTNITGSAEVTANILNEIEADIPDSASIASYYSRLSVILNEVDSIYTTFNAIPEEEINSKIVTKTKSGVLLLITEKDALKADLHKSVGELQDHYTRVDYLSKTWDASITAGQENNMPSAILERSNQVLAEVLIFSERLVETGDTVIYCSDQLLSGSKVLDELKSRSERYEQAYALKFLGKTHAALWEKDTIAATDTLSFIAAISEVKATYREGLSSFYANYKIKIYINLSILILLLIVTFLINKNLKRRNIQTEDERILIFLKIFRQPAAIALMLSLFIFLILYPKASVAVSDIASFLILIPFVLISLLVLNKRWHALVIILTFLFLFEEIIETLRFESYPIPRYFLLVISLLTFIYIIFELLKRTKEARVMHRTSVKLIDFALWASSILMIVILVTNIFGYVSLSFFLLRGLIIAAISGLLLSITVTIIDGFFTLLILGGSSHMYDVIRDYGNKLIDRIIWVVKLVALIYWFGIVLRRFMIHDQVMDWLTGIFETKWEFNEMIISVKGILLFGLIIFLSFWLSKFIRLLLEKEIFPRFKFSRGIPGIISLIIRVVIITIGFLLSFAALGINLDKLTILIGALGVGIGFGLQDIINNLISGFILVFERPIQVGDTVKFAEREGIVKEIGIRASRIKTYDGTEVIIPNGKLISNELVNLTLSDPLLRIEIDIGTDYDSDPQEVIDILVMQAKLHPDVSKNPEAFAIFFGYGDYALKFRLYTYTLEVNSRLRIRSELNLAIGAAFKEAGINIPFPKQDITVKMEDDEDENKDKE